ncbi:NUAK SNF1-like kinase 2, partial [Modicella reniformis]
GVPHVGVPTNNPGGVLPGGGVGGYNPDGGGPGGSTGSPSGEFSSQHVRPGGSHHVPIPIPIPIPVGFGSDDSKKPSSPGGYIPRGGPSTDDLSKQPSGPRGTYVPRGGPSTDNLSNLNSGSGSSRPTTPDNKDSHVNKGLLVGIAAMGAALIGKNRKESVDVTKTGKTTVIATKTGSGGRTVTTERDETGKVRHVLTGIAVGTTAVRVIAERTDNGEEILIPVDDPEGEEREVIEERDANGKLIRYLIRNRLVVTTTTAIRIDTERISTGELRHVIVGNYGGNAIRVFTDRNSTTREIIRMTPTDDETGELRHVTTERTDSGIRYIVGEVISKHTITQMVLGPRIRSERTSNGGIRYVIIDQYNGNAIRTKFERDEKTGEHVHIPVKESEGELRHVTEERNESGEIIKVIGTVITGNVTTTTRIVSGMVPEDTTSTQVRIVAEKDGDVTNYYHVTNGPDGQEEVRTLVEPTEDGGFRIPGGPLIVSAGAIGNQLLTTRGRSSTLTPSEQSANKTQITLKLSIMRYERADAQTAVPSAAVDTVVFSKFRILAPGEVDVDDTAHSHAEEVKAPSARRTIKWMKTEAHWKREAGMLQHLKSDRYIADLYTLYSLPAFAEYRYVSIMGSFSRTLDSYMKTEQLSLVQIRQLTASLSDALHWCHEHHVVHLNIRPASFYLDGVLGQDATDGNGQLVWKLWNFGHARFVGETVDTSVTTVTYAAPEILNGRKKHDANVLATVSMDRWSLGLILYELHARKAYFSSGAFAEFQLTQDEGARFEPALDTIREEDARQAIRGLLEADPERRYTHENLRDVYFGRN